VTLRVPSGEHLVGSARRQLALAAAVGVHDPEIEVAAVLGERDVGDLFAVRRPARMLFEAGIIGEREGIFPVRIHDPDVTRAVAFRDEHDLCAVGREHRMVLVGGALGKLVRISPVAVHDPDLSRR
jgi:hypothetical protein